MKMMFHIDDFKCSLCSNWFCPPFNLPYLLPCTHSICTSCLQKASSSNDRIICPQDLESCQISAININLTTKKALQRLMKQHKNYNQNTQFQCIKSLSIGFDQVVKHKQKQLKNLQALIDQIFESQINRLRHIHQKIKKDINRPYHLVQDWRQIVASHLTNIRKVHHNNNLKMQSNGLNNQLRNNSMMQLNHYIEEGRKIKLELNQFYQLQFDTIADRVMRNPRMCFDKDFTINAQILQNKQEFKTDMTVNKKHQSLGPNNKNLTQQMLVTLQFQKTQSQNLNKNDTLSFFNGNDTRKSMNQRPLANIDINRLSSKIHNDQIQGIQTKRGINKDKINGNKSSIIQNSQNVPFDRYFGNQCEKQHTKANKLRKQSQGKVKNNIMMNSPKLVSKICENKINKNLSCKQDSRLKHNQSRLQTKNNNQFSLSHFQLQTLQDEVLEKQRKQKQFNHQLQLKSKQLTKQQNQSYSKSEQQQMNRLAKMLDNSSNNHSARNSVRKQNKGKPQHKNSKINFNSENNNLLMSPNAIHQQYIQESEDRQPLNEQQQQLLGNQQLLVNENDNGWQISNINFLKEWKVKNQTHSQQPLQIKQNTYYYNCQKQKLTYMRKMQIYRVQQALKMTLVKDNYIQLINQSLHDVDMTLYLQQFDWKHSNIEIIKFVKTSLTDEQLNVLLNFLVKSNVKALVLSGNNLTDLCLDALLNFVTLNNLLKNVYLPKNYVNILKSKYKINLLKEKGVNIYI